MLMSVEHLSVQFGSTRAPIPVIDDVSLRVSPGECVGIVGESGAGKTTIIKSMMRISRPQGGQIRFMGEDIWSLNRKSVTGFRRGVQMVFQDPKSSLNPRATVDQLIGEGIRVHRLENSRHDRDQRIAQTMRSVGLDVSLRGRRASTLSGGQQQRIAIARALAIHPRLLVCDEPVSALDVSVQAQVINLLKQLQQELGLAIIFVAHDLAVVRHICQRLYVLNRGKIVEQGDVLDVFNQPSNDYTLELLKAVPSLDARHRRPS